MDRYLMRDLVNWQHNSRRKPLILNGARQVGKTWLLREFGRLHFDSVAYVNFDNNSVAQRLFEPDFQIKRLVRDLSVLVKTEIVPQRTLVIFDEVQTCPRALTSLKYFHEEGSEYTVAAAGSLLGVSANAGSGYPVGKVTTLNLYPISFREFLDATGNKSLRELLDSAEPESVNNFASLAIALLKQYYLVGGMPEVVNLFIEETNFAVVRRLQEQILEDYLRDFTKHAPLSLFPKMVEVWKSIPKHLARENKKFIFGEIRKGARAKDYAESLTWLSEAGLIQKVSRVVKPGIPLSSYDYGNAFKVFLLDVGLLAAIAGIDIASVVDGNAAFTEFKGALTEQFVCQQLVASCGIQPYYWSAENSTGEIDFLVQNDGKVFPIEVKAEENLRSKSLRAFNLRYQQVSPLRFSLSGWRKQDWMQNIPLWAIHKRIFS